jgi:Pyruvate/2-oxoacid:ferredoxin oxidoreductase delta subunit
MDDNDQVYRLLQQHLDSQPVGFPAMASGADITLLKRLFSPDEARLALHLPYKPTPLNRIVERAAPGFSADQVEGLLESMFAKGAIGWKEKSGVDHWYVVPLVVGMYENQDGQPTPEFLADAFSYMRTPAFVGAFIAAKPTQLRTIPINESIPVEHHVATYDQIRTIVETSPGPFVALKCICRESAAMGGKPCAVTSRVETCLGFNDLAAQVLRRSHGREISRGEAMEILGQNEKDGLVLQPANSLKPDFVCSCCGCCCGTLIIHKLLPKPLDFWTSNFYAEIEAEACTQCGECVSRCQVNAVSMTGPGETALIELKRCIGCGLCVPTCPSEAVRLRKKELEITPPSDDEALYDQIMANRNRLREKGKA